MLCHRDSNSKLDDWQYSKYQKTAYAESLRPLSSTYLGSDMEDCVQRSQISGNGQQNPNVEGHASNLQSVRNNETQYQKGLRWISGMRSGVEPSSRAVNFERIKDSERLAWTSFAKHPSTNELSRQAQLTSLLPRRSRTTALRASLDPVRSPYGCSSLPWERRTERGHSPAWRCGS